MKTGDETEVKYMPTLTERLSHKRNYVRNNHKKTHFLSSSLSRTQNSKHFVILKSSNSTMLLKTCIDYAYTAWASNNAESIYHPTSTLLTKSTQTCSGRVSVVEKEECRN